MAIREKPLTLSLIIPVYNEERYLRGCLESIAEQTVAPDEVIVVDNNSGDKTAEIALSFPFVRLIQEKEQGIVYARNTGFDESTGLIIGRIDADSILPVNWVEHILEFYSVLENQNHAWTGGGIFRNTRFPHIYGWVTCQVSYRFNRLLLGHYILWGSNMALTRAQWEKVRAKTCLDNHIHEDLDLAIHLNSLGFKITYQAFFKVSVVMRRLYRPKDLRENLMLWPESLKKHGKKTWVFGWMGARFFYFFRWMAWAVSADKKN